MSDSGGGASSYWGMYAKSMKEVSLGDLRERVVLKWRTGCGLTGLGCDCD